MTVDAVHEGAGTGPGGRALRPDALGTRHAVATGHPLAATDTDEAGVRWGAADPRRDSYAVAW